MTKNEALRIMNKFLFYETYTNLECCKSVNEIEAIFPFDKLFDYLLMLDILYDVMEKFVTMESDFASLSNVHYEDDPDNLEIMFDEEGNIIDLYCWTEVLGRTYSVKDHGIKWKEYEKTEADLKRGAEQEKCWQEERAKNQEQFKKYCVQLTSSIFPNMLADDNLEILPMTSAEYKSELLKKIIISYKKLVINNTIC